MDANWVHPMAGNSVFPSAVYSVVRKVDWKAARKDVMLDESMDDVKVSSRADRRVAWWDSLQVAAKGCHSVELMALSMADTSVSS